jgi:uncharacterized RDD family membrane protein YckC
MSRTAVNPLANLRRRQEIITPEGVPLSFETATVGERIGALLIDMILIGMLLLFGFIVFIALPLEKLPPKTYDWVKEAAMIGFTIAGFVLRSGYFLLSEMSPRAATFGKRIMKLRVISDDGARLTPAKAFTRNALREVELYLPLQILLVGIFAQTLIGSVLAIWVIAILCLPLFNKDHARLGDFLAGTRVVHMPKFKLSFDLADLEADRQMGLTFSAAQLAYGEMELKVLETVLRERKAATLRAVADRIKARIDWKAPENALDMPSDEHFLRAYYAALRAHLESKMLIGKRRKDKFDQ